MLYISLLHCCPSLFLCLYTFVLLLQSMTITWSCVLHSLLVGNSFFWQPNPSRLDESPQPVLALEFQQVFQRSIMYFHKGFPHWWYNHFAPSGFFTSSVNLIICPVSLSSIPRYLNGIDDRTTSCDVMSLLPLHYIGSLINSDSTISISVPKLSLQAAFLQ